MNLPSRQHSPALVYQFLHFVWHTFLPAVPVGLWWAGGLVVFCVLNLALEQEIWPNTPQAKPVLIALLLGSLLIAPWLLVTTTRRLTNLLASGWCWGFWKLVTIGCYLAIVLELFAACLVLAFILPDLLFLNQ